MTFARYQEALEHCLKTKEPVSWESPRGGMTYDQALFAIGRDSADRRGLGDDYKRVVLGYS